MIRFCTAVAALLASAIAAHAEEISVARVPVSGGFAVFRLFDDPARLSQCRGSGASAVIAEVEHPTTGPVGYGTGCGTAGADGYIHPAVKSFHDGRIRETKLHNSKFVRSDIEIPSGKAKARIDRVDELAFQCRDGSRDNPATVAACGGLEVAIGQVRQLGWCWGPANAAATDKRWMRCPR